MTNDITRQAVAALWEKARPIVLRRVAVVEAASQEMVRDTLSPELRRAAEQEAHKLAGAVGTYVYWDASVIARDVELLLAGTDPIVQADVVRLGNLVAQLKRQIEPEGAPPTRRAEDTPARLPQISRILLITADPKLAADIDAEAQPLGLQTATVRSMDGMRTAIAGSVAAAVIDLSSLHEGIAILTELHRTHPALPLVVISGADEMQHRVEAARFGGRGFLQQPVRASQVIDLLRDAVVTARDAVATIIAVDDDPAVLEIIQALLQPLRARVVVCGDPMQAVNMIVEYSPDLAILDVDMPGLDGIELCRVLRNDPRWATLPVLFLTAHTDAERVTHMFDAGADDFVAKPVFGPELVARVRNRLERTRILRLAADVDTLTGVSTRRRGIERLERCLQQAKAQHATVSIAVIDLDHFKRVNDEHGHVAGDAVLRRFAAVLTSCFRGDDIVARWGGEEFLVGMYGMTCEAAATRLTQSLARVRAERFDVGGAALGVTFSAGLAEFPEDGTDWPTLYRVADQALTQAKADGRNRVNIG